MYEWKNMCVIVDMVAEPCHCGAQPDLVVKSPRMTNLTEKNSETSQEVMMGKSINAIDERGRVTQKNIKLGSFVQEI